MTPIESIPFDTEEQNTEKTVETADIANNMAMIFADKYTKGLCTMDDIPESLRVTVQELLGGE